MEIRVKKLSEKAIIPDFQTLGAIAFDLHSAEDIQWSFKEPNLYEAIVETHLAFEIPSGFGMFLFPRSGLGFKYNIHLANGTGLIDSDYRGEIKIKLIAIVDSEPPKLRAKDRVAQASIIKVEKPIFKEVRELTQTDRGKRGFGSTGV